MKKSLFKLTLFAALFFGASGIASAQIYVKVRPVVPIVVRTERPSAAHIWIGEEWNENGDGYRYNGGHWDVPPHPGDRWYRGHWNYDHEHGHHWVAGSWHGGERRRK